MNETCVICMWETKDIYVKVWLGNYKGRLLYTHRHEEEDEERNIKMEFRETGCEYVNLIKLVESSSQPQYWALDSITRKELYYHFSIYILLWE
jgi:hypothetical protein